jgi:hypothetical protein
MVPMASAALRSSRAERSTRPRGRPDHVALAGGTAWLALILMVAGGALALSWTKLLLALAPLVLVPVGLGLLGPGARGLAARVHELTTRCLAPAAALAVVALVLPVGLAAGVVAATWLAWSAVAAFGALTALLARPSTETCARAVALGFLVVGAGWLTLSRLGVRPLDFPAAIVELTGVHFHYAGFASVTVAACLLVAVRSERRGAATAAVGLLAVAPPLVAAGFTFSPTLQVLGAVVQALGLWLLAALALEFVRETDGDRLARGLLAISALTVVVPMVLAVQWALGPHLGLPTLSIATMAATHGTANALGFALCGLVAWRRAGVEVAPGAPPALAPRRRA